MHNTGWRSITAISVVAGQSFACGYDKAASNGHGKAMNRIAELIANGMLYLCAEIKNDNQVYWLTQSANAGYAYGQYMLFEELRKSDDLSRQKLGVKWLKAASKLNYYRAQEMLAWVYVEGMYGQPKDESRALELFEASLTGHDDKLHKSLVAKSLAEIYSQHRFASISTNANIPKAIEMYRLCAKSGQVACYLELHTLYTDPTYGVTDYDEAYFLMDELLTVSEGMDFLKAEYQVHAHLKLGALLMDGHLGYINDEKARNHLQNALKILQSAAYRNKQAAENEIKLVVEPRLQIIKNRN